MSQFIAVIKVHNDWENDDLVDEIRLIERESIEDAFSTATQTGLSKAKELVRNNWLPASVCIVDVRVARISPGFPVDMKQDRENDDNFKSSFEHLSSDDSEMMEVE